jgi:hypothetical protein
MLKIAKREETRVPLDGAGAFIVLDPITPKMRRRVFKMYREALVQAGVDPAELAKGATLDADLVGDLGELISFELIRMGAREWGGIGDAIVRLAEWHFGGGDAGQRYCQLSCEAETCGRCEECPYREHEPQTEEGEGVWQVLDGCRRQLRRAGMAGVPVALDFGAVMAVGAAQDADLELLSDILPDFETVLLASYLEQSSEE